MSDYTESLAEFEEAIRKASEGQYVLKLFVTGSSTKSAKAITNVRAICEQYLAGRYDLEIIDIFQQPELAQECQLVVAPTLVKEKPKPTRKLVGDMSDEARVLYGLNIERKPN